MKWSDCDLVEMVFGKVSGEPLFKGTRLPARTVIENVDAYVAEGFSLDQAIQATLESFPTVPNGLEGVRTIRGYQAAFEDQPAS